MSIEPESESDQPLPVNLHFPDQRALTVDIDSIMRRGLRMRRTRKALTGAVAAVAIGGLGVSAGYLVPTTSSSAHAVSTVSPTGFQQSSVVRDHPPAGGRVTVLDSRANPQVAGLTASVVAWLSGGRICSGVANLTSTANDAVTCVSRPSALSTATPTVLAPHVVADTTDYSGSQLAIGFVSDDATITNVFLKIRGHIYDSAVVPLPGSASIGAYRVWIAEEDFVTTEQDFTQITGYTSYGVVVAHGQS